MHTSERPGEHGGWWFLRRRHPHNPVSYLDRSPRPLVSSSRPADKSARLSLLPPMSAWRRLPSVVPTTEHEIDIRQLLPRRDEVSVHLDVQGGGKRRACIWRKAAQVRSLLAQFRVSGGVIPAARVGLHLWVLGVTRPRAAKGPVISYIGLYLLRIVQSSRGLGKPCNPCRKRLSCVECDWTAEDVVDRVMALASAGGAGFCGGSGIRAPAATGSSSRGTSIAKLPG